MSLRKIYNQIGIFAGCCPSTGFHYLDFYGNPINSIYSSFNNSTGYSYNRVNQLNRVIDAQYGFNESRIDIKNLGNYSTLARPSLVSPVVSLSLSYYSMGLINEARLGFVFNTPSGNNPNNQPIYSTNICPITGFLDRTYQQDFSNSFINTSGQNEYWLNTNRDCKNLFIITNDSYDDLKYSNGNIQSLNGTTGTFINNNVHMFSFGDCYLENYKFSAAVGSFPQVSVDYSAYNVIYSSGASGINIPSVNPKDLTIRTGIYFNIPEIYTGNQCTVLAPGDIKLSISLTGTNQTVELPVALSDLKVQNFNIDLNLNREPLQNLGYRLPLDRRINPPVYANLTLSAIVGDSSTGSFIDFINLDNPYNVSININYSKNQSITGTAINFQFLACLFNSIKLSDSISSNRMLELSLSSELDPSLNNKGFFMSGQLGIPQSNQPQY